MVHSYTNKGAGKANQRYRYYVCLAAQKRGWHTCATKSVPAAEIERFVVEQVRGVGRDPAVLDRTIRQMREQSERAIAERRAEVKSLERELARHAAAMKKALGDPEQQGGAQRVPDCVFVDAGYQTDVVYAFCREAWPAPAAAASGITPRSGGGRTSNGGSGRGRSPRPGARCEWSARATTRAGSRYSGST